MAKLTARQWIKLKSRMDAGETAADLAREYKITRQAIYDRFNGIPRKVKTAANQIVANEQALQKTLQNLTPTLQIDAWSLAADLLHASKHLGGGAKYNAMTFHKLAGMANIQAQKLDDENIDTEAILNIGGLIRVSNEAAKAPMDMIKANQKAIELSVNSVKNGSLVTLTDEELERIIAGK